MGRVKLPIDSREHDWPPAQTNAVNYNEQTRRHNRAEPVDVNDRPDVVADRLTYGLYPGPRGLTRAVISARNQNRGEQRRLMSHLERLDSDLARETDRIETRQKHVLNAFLDKHPEMERSVILAFRDKRGLTRRLGLPRKLTRQKVIKIKENGEKLEHAGKLARINTHMELQGAKAALKKVKKNPVRSLSIIKESGAKTDTKDGTPSNEDSRKQSKLSGPTVKHNAPVFKVTDFVNTGYGFKKKTFTFSYPNHLQLKSELERAVEMDAHQHIYASTHPSSFSRQGAMMDNVCRLRATISPGDAAPPPRRVPNLLRHTLGCLNPGPHPLHRPSKTDLTSPNPHYWVKHAVKKSLLPPLGARQNRGVQFQLGGVHRMINDPSFKPLI